MLVLIWGCYSFPRPIARNSLGTSVWLDTCLIEFYNRSKFERENQVMTQAIHYIGSVLTENKKKVLDTQCFVSKQLFQIKIGK